MERGRSVQLPQLHHQYQPALASLGNHSLVSRVAVHNFFSPAMSGGQSRKEGRARRLHVPFDRIDLPSLFSYKRKPLRTGTPLLFQAERKYRMLLKLNCREKHPPLFSLTTLFCFLIDIWKCTVSGANIHMNLLPETNVTENLPQD